MAEQGMDIKMDPNSLYREEVFTDRTMGTIMRMTPVDAEGNRDDSRDVVYVGQTQVMTPAGALPLSFELRGKDLAEAAEGFGPAAEKALEETMEKLKEMRREQASGLVIPGAEGVDPFGGQGGPGGMPGGGKIQLR
ncbi:hypothetical protein [Alkalilimnicola sp. S0819]|uniref:hypothetical protein n=1 Tax=Alkalilimnicola sp. S0819 TaxID=2613922 RepID=UPI001261B70B|nr:hypothetical protein [Alkalilimnicola sp. S0819]KAB7627810.1 hypothetical protein F3N43_02205 [Alkalilimnicola sp. S0819]MPQ15441.1 hypothetical protein [Alkalilimnicola sp. S0819]